MADSVLTVRFGSIEKVEEAKEEAPERMGYVRMPTTELTKRFEDDRKP